MGIWDLWNRKSSKDFAKDRLKLLLVSDGQAVLQK